MYAGGAAGQGHFHAVVDDQRHAVPVGEGFDFQSLFQKIVLAYAFFPQLHQGDPGFQRLFHLAVQADGTGPGPVGDGVKPQIQAVYKLHLSQGLHHRVLHQADGVGQGDAETAGAAAFQTDFFVGGLAADAHGGNGPSRGGKRGSRFGGAESGGQEPIQHASAAGDPAHHRMAVAHQAAASAVADQVFRAGHHNDGAGF